ncbi:MAG TPA: crosslink repair DNA glycosylase YcaQ family protein, partial [Thermoleophilaceae bacterium]|nr:crosslink repair DNA glycosylase YcaQ family protein [Thermoleophilaceae bacterium]
TELGGGLVDLAKRPGGGADHEPPQPRLLGAFEPLLLGWRSRARFVGRHEAAVIAGGMFRPFAMVRGRAVATWRLRGDEVEVEPFARIARADSAALEADGDAVVRYLGARRVG